MTVQDFKLIADEIEDVLTSADTEEQAYGISRVAMSLADRFEQECLRFDKIKFLRACGTPLLCTPCGLDTDTKAVRIVNDVPMCAEHAQEAKG